MQETQDEKGEIREQEEENEREATTGEEDKGILSQGDQVDLDLYISTPAQGKVKTNGALSSSRILLDLSHSDPCKNFISLKNM